MCVCVEFIPDVDFFILLMKTQRENDLLWENGHACKQEWNKHWCRACVVFTLLKFGSFNSFKKRIRVKSKKENYKRR